jgi:hypothetical protein
LLAITKGRDQTSSRGILYGLGALGRRIDRVGDDPEPAKSAKDKKGRGIIAEFRNMPRNQLYSDVIPTFRKIFKYLVALNNEGRNANRLEEII